MKKQISIVFSALWIIGMLLTACQPQATPTAVTTPDVVAPAPTEPQAVAPEPTEPAVVATEAPQPAAKPIVAVCLPALDNPLMLAFQDAIQERVWCRI